MLAVDGADGGRRSALELPPIPPRSSVDVPVTGGPRGRPGRDTITIRVGATSRPRPAWAPGVGGSAVRRRRHDGATAGRHRVSDPAAPIDLDDDYIDLDGILAPCPACPLWRPPTDNDDPPGHSRVPPPVAPWRDRSRPLGVHRRVDDAAGRREDPSPPLSDRHGVTGLAPSTPSWPTTARWSRRARRGRPAVNDLPRAASGSPSSTTSTASSGSGSVPATATPIAFRRRTSVAGPPRCGQTVPFVVPQEYGLHLDTEWFELSTDGSQCASRAIVPWPSQRCRIGRVSRRAAHAHELPRRSATQVHLDVAHRGLGTAACGPDTHPRHQVPGGTYAWTWTLHARPRRG